MDELIKIIFGDYTTVQLIGFLWFFIIGYLAYGLLETTGRDVQGTRTPKKWKWGFWLKDNIKRYITTIICTYLLFRFYVEFVGHEFTYFEAVMLGLLGDGASATIKKRVKQTAVDRERLMNSYNDKEVG